MRLEDLTPGATVRGILPDAAVSVESDQNWPEHLRFKDLEAAYEYAERFARSTGDYGEWLIQEGWNSGPSARATLFNSFEEDD